MRRGKCCNESGQALVETALVLPIILLIVMGVLTFGMIIYVKMLVVLSSSQAAKVASSIYNDTTLTGDQKVHQIQSTAYTYLSNGISGTDRSADIIVDDYMGTISVKVTYNYKMILPLLGDIFGTKTKIPLSYTSTYMIQ